MPVTSQIVDNIGVVTFSNPPLNPISGSAGIPQGVAAEVAALAQNPQVRAIVLAAVGKMFSAGADIAEFNNDPAAVGIPIRALMAALDESALPIVAAIQGSALGGGLEVALACDYRVIGPEVRLGLPEVTLGIIPGAGGTQRLPRLVGAAKAATMIATAATIAAAEAKAAGLADAIAEGDLLQSAIAFARSITGQRRRVRDLPVGAENAPETLANLRATLPRDGRAEAVSAALDALETGMTQGFDAGVAKEYRMFDELLSTEAARGLR